MTTPPSAAGFSARIEAVSGPLRGRIFELAGDDIHIGRAPGNDIVLEDSLVSRRHCRIRRAPEGHLLTDLDSSNCTFVNGLPVNERLLSHEDLIRAGESTFIYLTGPSETTSRVVTSAPEPELESQHQLNFVLPRDEVLSLSERRLEPLPADSRLLSDLKVLLNFSRGVNSARGFDAISRHALDSAIEVSSPDRAALVVLDSRTQEITATWAWDRSSGFHSGVSYSRTIVDLVLREGTALLATETTSPELLRNSESLHLSGIRSVIAVPLATPDAIHGALYLDTADLSLPFSGELLQLIAGIAGITALAVANARHMERLEEERQLLQDEINLQHGMVGDTPPMRAVYQFVSRVAPTDATVLIWGESGTGKELVARAIHTAGKRAARPFAAINCAAIAESLLESELFGHEKGAFTGAAGQKKGKFELAEGGTVFLDEISELAPALQAKLLRVLQEKECERVGGTRSVKLDIRIIAATNRDLKAAVKEGKFREDLFYRLNVVSVRTPALRERREDIPLLANYFVSRFAAQLGRQAAGISAKARACLLAYDWPGNVRELQNAIERAMVLGSGGAILPEDLPETLLEVSTPDPDPNSPSAFHDGVREAKRQLILKAIDQAGGNYTDAARLLGLHPNHLFRLVRTLNLTPKRQRR